MAGDEDWRMRTHFKRKAADEIRPPLANLRINYDNSVEP